MAWLHLPVRVPSFSRLLLNLLTLVCSYIRLPKSPALYSVGVDYQGEDGTLVQKRADIATPLLSFWRSVSSSSTRGHHVDSKV